MITFRPIAMRRTTFYSLACGILPLVIVHLAYWINKLAGVDLDPAAQCNPYIEGCVSTSGAVRGGPGLIPFKALMLPVCVFLILTWRAARRFARGLESGSRQAAGIMRTLGVIGALALVIYVVWLGTDGVFYGWLRRYGATVFFGCTALAQLLFTRLVWRAKPARGRALQRALLAAVTLQWLIGTLHVGKRLILEHEQAIFRFENIMEWWFLAVLSAGFILMAGVFRLGHATVTQSR